MAAKKPARRSTRPRTSTAPRASTTRPSLAERAGTSVKRHPVASAAIATGLVSGVAAAVAGFFAFKKSGKSFGDFSTDVTASLKDKAADVADRVKDGIADVTTKAKDIVDHRRDGIDPDTRQAEIAQEALTLKQTGRQSTHPVDTAIAQELKTGAITY